MKKKKVTGEDVAYWLIQEATTNERHWTQELCRSLIRVEDYAKSLIGGEDEPF